MIVNILASFGILVGAILLQTAVLPAFGATAVAPCLVICAVVVVAFQTSPYVGMGAGLATGLIMDSLFSQGIGNYALVLVVIGYVAGMAGERFKPEALIITAVLAAMGHIGFELFSVLLLYFSDCPLAMGWGGLWRGTASVVLTGLCTVPVHLLLYRVMDKRRKHNDDYGMLFAG